MPIEVRRARSEGSDHAVVIGTIDWSPDGWSYDTEDEELKILLDKVMTDGTVIAYTSVDVNGTTYDFVEEEVDSSDTRFISGLSTLLDRTTRMFLRVVVP